MVLWISCPERDVDDLDMGQMEWNDVHIPSELSLYHPYPDTMVKSSLHRNA